jgi:hypothetical protein
LPTRAIDKRKENFSQFGHIFEKPQKAAAAVESKPAQCLRKTSKNETAASPAVRHAEPARIKMKERRDSPDCVLENPEPWFQKGDCLYAVDKNFKPGLG